MLQANLQKCLHLMELIWVELMVLACPDLYAWDYRCSIEWKNEGGGGGREWHAESETSLQSWFNYPFVRITFFPSFSPCPFNGSYERWICLSLQSTQHTSNYISGYLFLKSFTWPACSSFQNSVPLMPSLMFCFTSCTSIRFPARFLPRPWKSCLSQAHFSSLLRMLRCPVKMLIIF